MKKIPERFLSAASLCSAVIVIALGWQPAIASEVTMQDGKMLVSFNSETGALTRLVDKTTGWTIERRPDLGLSFRMLVPLPNRQDNFIYGQKQRAVKVYKVSDNEVVLEWKNLLSQHGGVLPITLKVRVTLNDGVLTFYGEVVNDSKLSVQTVSYPYFGDINPPDRNSRLAARTMWYGDLGNDELYPNFGNERGYWGVNYPTKTFESYRSLFCLIQAPSGGLYVEMKDHKQPYLMEYTFQQLPGLISGMNSRVPHRDEIPGKPLKGDTAATQVPVHLEFMTCHFIYAHPHTTFKFAPVVVQFYRGDWHAGVDVYKNWRAKWFKPPYIPKWARKVNSWTMLRLNTPVQDYTIRYSDLVQYGEQWAANGIDAVQVVGWNKGGQDGDDPSLAIDPNLGTWQQFHDAIQKVQAMGVHVMLFGKLHWADLTTKWYKTQLYKYDCTDPYGIPYEQGGYSYVTPVQLAAINNHRRAIMDVLDPAYRKVAVGQFERLLSLGSAGWLFDELCQHGIVKYSFAKGHGYTPPGFIYAGDLPFAKELREVADSIAGRNFAFAGEGQQDWLMQYYPFSETGVRGTPVCQYIDTRHSLMIAGVSGFDDRETPNVCLLDHYIMEYEPYYYKGHIDDFPLTLAYGKKIDALRRKYSKYLWNAKFRDTLGAKVTANGPFKYSVYLTSSGERAVVVVNMSYDKPITATVDIPNHGKLVLATPEKPDAVPTSGVLQIPARSSAVVMEH